MTTRADLLCTRVTTRRVCTRVTTLADLICTRVTTRRVCTRVTTLAVFLKGQLESTESRMMMPVKEVTVSVTDPAKKKKQKVEITVQSVIASLEEVCLPFCTCAGNENECTHNHALSVVMSVQVVGCQMFGSLHGHRFLFEQTCDDTTPPEDEQRMHFLAKVTIQKKVKGVRFKGTAAKFR